MPKTLQTWQRPQTNTAGVTPKDRTSAGPRPDGGEGGEVTDVRGIIPVGGIVMWAGAFADVPQGWHLCDGEEGTVDLTDRFVLGTNTEADVGDVGGASTHSHGVGTLATDSVSGGTPAGTLSDESAHTHSVTSNVSVADHAAHTHAFTSSSNALTPDLLTENTGATGVAASGTTGDPSATLTHAVTNNAVASGAGSAHTHTFTGAALAGHTHTVSGDTADASSLPPWFKLAFIQRIF